MIRRPYQQQHDDDEWCFHPSLSLSLVLQPNNARNTKVAVIGAGIAGCSNAWALKRAGFQVTLFETREVIGGNAKTFLWNKGTSQEVLTGLSVLAWPPEYFRNYCLLLKELNIESQQVHLPFFVKNPELGVFAHTQDTAFKLKHKASLDAWCQLVEVVRSVNSWLTGTGNERTFYAFSFANPFNVIPLRALAWAFGITSEFWDNVIVPVYSSSFLTAKLNWLPAVIAPAVDDLIPIARGPIMDTWTQSSKEVFDAMVKGVEVITSVKVTKVSESRAGKLQLETEDGRGAGIYDNVVFACSADNALAILDPESTNFLERMLLNSVAYTDDDDDTFLEGTIHQDASVLPEEHRDEILERFANYVEVTTTDSGELNIENTFCVGSWVPSVQRKVATARAKDPLFKKLPFLITYKARHPIRNPLGTVSNLRAHPHLNVRNLAMMLALRYIQGRRGVYYCSSFTTPGNGHDLSLLSGFIVAHALGAPYPFPGAERAREDFDRLRFLMGL